MNTLIFLAGGGAGCLVTCIAFIVIIGQAASGSKGSAEANKKHMATTEELLNERNHINAEISQTMKEILAHLKN